MYFWGLVALWQKYYFMKHKNVWSDYDKETDTLYMQFTKPNYASNSELTEDDIIIRYN